MMTQTLKIGLPVKKLDNGDKVIKSKFLEVLEKSGLLVKPIEDKTRPFTVLDFVDLKSFKNQIMVQTQPDILNNLQDGIADVGLVGRDKFNDFEAEIELAGKTSNLELSTVFDQAACRMVIAAPAVGDNITVTPQYFSGKRIATSFPNILEQWCRKNNVRDVTPVERDGAIEIYVGLGAADAVFDITESGTSLKRNGLKEYFELVQSSAVLVVSKHASDGVQDSIDLFRRQLASQAIKQEVVPAFA